MLPTDKVDVTEMRELTASELDDVGGGFILEFANGVATAVSMALAELSEGAAMATIGQAAAVAR